MNKSIKLAVILALLALLAACGGQSAVEEAASAAESELVEEAAEGEAAADEMSAPEEEASEETAGETADDGEATASAEGYPITVTDMTGRMLTVESPPQRIVCLFNRCAQELAFVGVAPIAVGAPWTFNVARDPINFGEQAETFGQITQDPEINWEQVASYQPDLIIGDDTMLAAAEGIAPLYALSWDASVEETIENFTTDVRNYGHIFGIKGEVEPKIQNVLDRVAAYAELSPNDRSLLVINFGDNTGSTVWIPPNCGLFLSQLSPCGNPDGIKWIEGSIETLLSFNPDVLIVEQYSVTDEAALLENLSETNPLWNELTAVQNGKVHLVPVSQARTNTIQSVEGAVDAIMPLVYPDILPGGPLTDEQVQEILAGETAAPENEAAADGCEEGFRLFVHYGGETCIPENPQRIVTTQDQNGLLPLLELGVKPAGSAGQVLEDGGFRFRRLADYDTSGIEFVGSYWGEGNFESIAAVQPDLIVSHEFAEAYYDIHSEIAPTVMIQIMNRPLSEVLLDFADVVNRTDEAEALQAAYQARIDGLLEALSDRREALSISLISAEDPGQFSVMTDGGQAVGTVMWDLNLLRPEPQQVDNQWESFSIETLSDHDADLVLVFNFAAEGQDPNFDSFMASPIMGALKSSQADQVYVVDGLQTVGSSWGKMDTFIDELEAILLDPELDVDVVQE